MAVALVLWWVGRSLAPWLLSRSPESAYNTSSLLVLWLLPWLYPLARATKAQQPGLAVAATAPAAVEEV